MLEPFNSDLGMVVELEADGKMTQWQMEGKVPNRISEAQYHQGTLYMGSYKHPFLAKRSLSRAHGS